MIYLLVSAGIFIVILGVQVLVHRTVLAHGSVAFRLFGLYLIGALMVVFCMRWLPLAYNPSSCTQRVWCYPLPGSAIAMYLLLAVDWIVMSISPILGDESPSSTIVQRLSVAQPRRYQDIVSFFSDERLIIKRLQDMIASGWIRRVSGERYQALPWGQHIVRWIIWYRSLLCVSESG